MPKHQIFSAETPNINTLLLEHARQVAVNAGKWLVQQRSNFSGIHYQCKKNHIDLVTEFDRNCEAMIIASIKERFPQHLIVSEEAASESLNLAKINQADEYCWVIDPLDGTMNFVHGIPHFAVSIGIVKNGQPVVGVVYDPNRDELFSAASGLGVTMNEQKLTVSEQEEFGNSIINTGFSA